jgi:hypothetical protein
MANAPLPGTGCASLSDDLPDGESGKYLRDGLDRQMNSTAADLPVGQGGDLFSDSLGQPLRAER